MRNDRLYEAYMTEATGPDLFEEAGGFWLAVPPVVSAIASIKFQLPMGVSIPLALSPMLILLSANFVKLYISKKRKSSLLWAVASGLLAIVASMPAGPIGIALSSIGLGLMSALSIARNTIAWPITLSVLMSSPIAVSSFYTPKAIPLAVESILLWMCLLLKKDIHDSLKPHMVENVSTAKGVDFVSKAYAISAGLLAISSAVSGFVSLLLVVPAVFPLLGLKLRAEAAYYLNLMAVFLFMMVIAWL